jgi:hypothetical protein
MTYIIEDDGKTNAQAGSHDDIVMSAAIILYVMEQYATPVTEIITSTSAYEPDVIDSKFVLTDDGFRHKSEIPQDDEDADWFKGAGW